MRTPLPEFDCTGHELLLEPLGSAHLHGATWDDINWRWDVGCWRRFHAGKWGAGGASMRVRLRVPPAVVCRYSAYTTRSRVFPFLQLPNFGGAGAFVTGNLPVTPGETLRILVGAGGVSSYIGYASTDYYGTYFGERSTRVPYTGSSGGGRSAIQRFVNGAWVDVVSAAGGGASGFSYCPPLVSACLSTPAYL